MATRFDRRGLLFASAGLAAFGAASCKKVPGTCPPGNMGADELRVRATLGYVDQTSDPAKPCVRCTQYIPATGGDHCGGCKIMKGPIHPNGYCKAFAAV
jgi:hypothetical protein